MANVQNLTPYKKGEARARINGQKGGKKSVRVRSVKTILKSFLELEPEQVFALSEKEEQVAKILKKLKCETAKDLVYWKLLEKAKNGDINAIKMVSEHIGEDPGTILKVGGLEDAPPIAVDKIVNLSIEELQEMANRLVEELSDN